MKHSKPCQSCGRRIYVLRHRDTNRWAPIEVDTDPRGNIRVDLKARRYDTLTAENATEARLAGEGLHLNHFAECPYAPKHRSRR